MTASDPLGFLPPFESTSKLVALEIDVYESINVEWMVERGSGPVDLVAYRVIDPTGRIDEGTVIAKSQPFKSNYTWTPVKTSPTKFLNAGNGTYFMSLIGSSKPLTNSSFFDVVHGSHDSSPTSDNPAIQPPIATNTFAPAVAESVSSSAPSTASSNTNAGAVIGGSIAASICVLLLFVALFYLLYRRKRRGLDARGEADQGPLAAPSRSETNMLPMHSKQIMSPVGTIHDTRWPIKDKDAPLPFIPQEKDAGYVRKEKHASVIHEMDSGHVAELPA